MQSKSLTTLLATIFSLSILYIGFLVERTDFNALFFSFLISFLGFLYLSKIFFRNSIFEIKIIHLIYLGIALRFVLCFSFPHLSDDIFRFYWDGKLIAHGYNPFSHLPSYFIDNQLFTSEKDIFIFQHLNSPNYFSVYPPVCQIVFFLAYKMSFENIFIAAILMKLFLFACEVGTIFLIKKMSSKQNALLYALNPLCIIEICGNLHFEGAMIFFFVAMLYVLDIIVKNNSLFTKKLFIVRCSLLLALSVCSKLLTLMFLPILTWELVAQTLVRDDSRTKVRATFKSIIFPIFTIFFIVLFFYPLISETFVANFSKSINLYFQKFEFNASLYYLIREYGFWKVGYNTIQTTGWKLGVVSGILILAFSYLQGMSRGRSGVDKLSTGFLFVLLIYFSLSTIVHPWYVTSLLAFSVFTHFRFAVLWTALIFLSYGGYSQTGFSENHLITAFEYVAVFGYLGYELLWKEKESVLQ